MKFSVPVNHHLTEKEFLEFEELIVQAKDIIYDLYCTYSAPPFTKDVMCGSLQSRHVNYKEYLERVTYLKEKYGFKLSATTNNICANVNLYDDFIFYFRKYAELFDSIVIPFPLWLRFGFKKEFPHILVKNTLLQKIRTSSEVFRLFIDGYDIIICDRSLTRSFNMLRENYKVKQLIEEKLNKRLYIMHIANEGCVGCCPTQHDHYNVLIHGGSFPSSYQTCKLLPITQIANILPLYSEYEYYTQVVDIYKLQGRAHIVQHYMLMTYLKNIVEKKEVLYKPDIDVIKERIGDDFDNWSKYIRTCEFKCYKCKYANKCF